MNELIQYLESNGIQYEAIPRSRFFVIFIIVFCVIAALFFIWSVILRDRKFYGHITKSSICLILFIVMTFSFPPIVLYTLRDEAEAIRIQCSDEQFVEMFKMGYKFRLGDSPDEWVCYGYGK